MYLRQRNRRFSATVVALTFVGAPLAVVFISQIARAGGGTVGSGACQVSVSETSTVSVTESGGKCIYTFTDGNNSITPPSATKRIDFLAVGGGGGGGSNRGGGGGAGGFFESSWTYTSGAVNVVVGSGGAGGGTPTSNIGVQGTDGGSSSIAGGGATFAAGGGGGGGAHGVGSANQGGRNGVAVANGYSGPSGSGGGASMNYGDAGHAGGTATAGSGYANAGATSRNDVEPNRNSGGGGGAGSAGIAGSGGDCGATSGVTPDGGSGRSSSISGSSVTYAAGGGGADGRGATEICAGPDTPRSTSGRGLGGSGIGGNGAALGGSPTSAAANSGSGGGAGNSDSSGAGSGGSGVIVLSIDATKPVSSGTTTTDYLPKASSSVVVAYSATDANSVSSVAVFYSESADLSSPTQCGSATGLSGTSASGNITCTVPSSPTTSKTYFLYTVATDASEVTEDAPTVADDSFVHDAITPLSTANIVRNASNTSVVPVDFTATDAVGLASVKAYVTINSNLLGGSLCGTTSVTGTSASGTVNCTMTSPSNGTRYYFYTMATDLAGQVEASADYTPGDSAKYDITRPGFSNGPVSGVRVKSSGTITITPDEAGTLYFVSSSASVTDEASITSLNDNQFNSVSVSSAYVATDLYATGLPEGSYKLYMVDEAGNVSNAYGQQVVVDDTAPTKPTAVGVYWVDDTGTSSSDGVTKNTAPNVVATTSEGNGQVTFTAVKGASTATCTDVVYVSGSAGETMCKFSTLATGTWTITAVHTDGAGNIGPVSDTYTMVIDTTAPARPSDADLVDAYDYGNSSSDNITSASYAYYKATSPSGESNGMIELKMKSGTTYVSTCTYYDTDTVKQCQLEPNANDGTFQVEAWYYDQAGNSTGSTLAIGFTYDRTAPLLTTTMSGTIGLTQTVSGSSNSIGRLWLVDGYANSSLWPDFTGLLDNKQNYSSYPTANASVTVAATGLADGWYYMYATDVAGNISARSTNYVMVDATLPTVTQLTATSGRYKAGMNIDISVTFSENVVVTLTPQILLNLGAGHYANYLSGSGTSTLIFRYVVLSNTNTLDLDYASTTALASGTIKDAYANSAVLTLPATGSANSIAGSSDVVIDTTAPTVTFTNPASAYSNATSVTYTFTFSEQVSAPTSANFSNTGTSTGCSYNISTTNNISYTVAISSCTDGTIIPRLAANAVNDLAGNAGPGSAVTAGTTNFDHVAPIFQACTCTKASGAAGTFTSVTLNSTGTVYLVNSTVTVNSLADITSASGELWNSNSVVASTSMGVYATGLAEGTYKLYATDLAGNFSAVYSGSLIVENVAPTFTVVGGTYGNGKTISSTSSEVGTVWYILQSVSMPSPVTADFLQNSPLVLNKRVVTNITSANTPTLSQSIVQTSQFPSGVYDAYAVDEAGNVSPVLSSAITLDTTAPTLTSISSSSPNGTYLYGQTINIDVTFSKAMKANSTVNLILETGASDRTVNYSSGTGTNVLTFVYTVQAGDTSSDLDLVSTATLYSAGNLSDIYGNVSTQGCCNNYAAPVGTATTGSLANAKDIVVDGVVPVVQSSVNSANGNQSNYYTTVTFSGDVTDFDLSDISRAGSATGCTTGLSATSASVYVISYTGCSDGTITSTIRVDAVAFPSGNRGPKSANVSSTLTKDTTAPVVTQSPAVTYFNSTSTIGYTVNEISTIYLVNTANAVTDVASITGLPANQKKSFSYVSGSQTFNGTGLQDGLYKIYAVDAYGNLSTGSTANYLLDTVAPTVTLTSGTVIIGGSATLRSNDIGTFYLVKSTVNVTNLASITGAGASNYKSQAITSANADQSVAVSGLSDGTYYAYTTDGGMNLSPVSTASITVDNTAPTVTNATAASTAGNYIFGSTVLIDVLFGDVVNVSTAGGTPTLLLETGATDRQATYLSGSGTNTLRFTYTVQDGDTSSDLNYQSSTALAANGGTITDNNGNNAVLTMPSTAGSSSLAFRSAIFVKGTRVSVVGLTVTSPTAALSFTYNFSFNESIYGLTTSDFTFGGTATGCSVSSVGSPTSSAGVVVTGCSDGTVILKLPAGSALDYYNNPSPAVEYVATTVTVDRTGPVPTIVLPTTPTSSSTITFTVNYNETMSGLVIGDFTRLGTATGCSAGTVSAASGTVVNVSFTGCGEGTVILRQNASTVVDSLANTGPATAVTSATVTIDKTKATVSSFIPSTTPTNATSPTFVLTMNEAITGLDSSDFTVSGTASGCSLSPVSTTGTVITVTAMGCGEGTVIPKLLANGVTDIAGNISPTVDYTGTTLTIDRTAPNASVAPVMSASSDVGVSSSDSKTNLTTLSVSSSTSEATGSLLFSATDGVTTVTCNASVSSSTGSCSLTGLTEGVWTVTSVFSDSSGNAGVASTATTMTIDTSAPTVAITSPSSPVRSMPTTFTVTFSESINGLISSDFSNNAGSATGCTFTPSSSSGTTISVTVDMCSDGTLNLSIGANSVSDVSGNNGPSTTTTASAVTIDNGPPIAVLTPATLKNSQSATVRLNKLGVVYLVKSTVSVATESDITSAAGNTWNSVNVTVTDSDTSLSLTGLVDGTYRAYGVDAQNRLSVVSTTSVSVDTTAPSAPVSVILDSSSDTGTSSSDGITKDNTPTIRIVASENGGTVTVTASRVFQNDVVCTVTGSTVGSTCDLSSIVDGVWTLSAVQTDAAGNISTTVTGSMSIDTVGPTVSGVSTNSASGAKKAGASIDVRVTFDTSVVVDATSGSPTLLMETGITDRASSFTSGSASTVLVFTYTVQAGDASSDLDYVGTSSLALNGSAVTDAAGNNAVVALATPGTTGSLSDGAAIVIDTSAPITPALTTATITASMNAVVSSSELGTVYLVKSSIAVTTLADIANANSAQWNQVSITSANTNTDIAATGLVDGTYVAYAVDAAENISSASTGTVTIDSTSPTVAITASPTSIASGGTSTLTFTLSETVAGFDASDLTAGLGTISGFTGSGTQFTATFTASSVAGGTGRVTIAANSMTDSAGNGNPEAIGNITVASPAGTNGRESASSGNTNYIIEQFTTAGTYRWTVPSNVTSVEYIVIGGGGGGGGGGYVPGGNGGGGGGGAAGSLRMGTASVVPGTELGIAVGTAGTGGIGGKPSMTFQYQGTTATGGGASSVFGIQANGGYGGCASGLNASVTSCGYLLINDGYGGYGGNNAIADGGARASILGGGGGGGAGSSGTGGSTSSSSGGVGGVGTAANFYGIADTFGTGGNGGPGAVGALNGTNGTRRGNGGNGGGGGLNGSNAGSGGNGSDGFVAIRYAIPVVTEPNLEDSSDTGTSNTDNLTRLTTPTFSGTAAVGATVQLFVDSVASGAPCTADLNTGLYSCTTGTLSHGIHTVTAKSSILLAGGLAESTSTALTIAVDTVKPVATLTTATVQWGDTATGESNELGTGYLVKDTEAVTDLASITNLADNRWNQVSLSNVGTATSISTSGLMSGDYKLYSTDPAGNISLASTGTVTFVDDTTAPTATMTTARLRSSDSTAITSTELGTVYLVKSTVNVSSVADITGAAINHRKTNSVVTANTAVTVSLSGLAEGTYYAYAVDRAGNLSVASTTAITIDNTLPTVSSFASSATSYIVRNFDLTLTMSESVTGLSSSDFSNGGTASSCTFTPDVSSGTTFTVSVSCSTDGTVVARLGANGVTDLAGNTGPASQSSAATVTLGATPTKLILTTSSSGSASGAAFATQPVVSLANAQDLVVTSYTATVTAAITQINGKGSLVGTTTAAVDTTTGAATFADLGITGTAGTSYTITYSSGSLVVATQSVNVTVGAATRLEIGTQPVGGASGAVLATQPIVNVVDSGSNIVSSASASVSVSTTSGTLGGTRPKVTASGVATFTDLTFSGLASQSHTLTFTASGLTSVTSASFNVTAGAATQLVLTTQSVGTESGAAFTTQPVLEVRDSGGNKVVSSSATVNATVSNGAVLEGVQSATASSGVATFSTLGISGRAGTSYTITYSATGLSPAVQAVTPTVGPATRLQIDTQPVGAGAGAQLSTQPVVQVVDSGGNVIVGSNASIAVSSSAGTLGGNRTITAVSGEAFFTNLTFAGTAGSNYRLEFTSLGLTSATSNNFTVSVGAATHLAITRQPVGDTAGSLLSTQPVVKVLDAGDNVVTSSTSTIDATANAGVLGGTTSLNAVNGVATFTSMTFAGTVNTDYALTFASTGLGTVQSTNIRVTLGVAAKLAINTNASGATYKHAFTTQPVVEVQDAGGNRTASTASITATLDNGTVLSGLGATKSTTAVNGVATFSGFGIIGTPGSYNILYSAPSLQGATQSITLNKADQTINTVAIDNRVFSTTPFALSASPDSGLIVTWTSSTTSICTVSNSNVTMIAIGTCSVTASQSGNTNYNAAANEIRTFTISRATPVVTFNALPSKTYGDASFTVSATADMPVQLSFAGTSGVCNVGTPTLATNTSSVSVTIVTAGTCTITVSRAQDATYEAAVAAVGSTMVREFFIAKAAGTISFTQNTLNQTYNGSGRAVAATSNAGSITITYTGIAPTIYAPSTTAPINAGSYAVVAVQNDTNYEVTAAATLVVAKAQGSVVLDANTLVQTYSGTSRSAAVSSTTPSSLATVITYTGSQGTVYGPSTFAPTDAGFYDVSAAINEMNYQGTATGTMRVDLGVQSTISFINGSSTSYDRPINLLAVGGTGTGSMSYAVSSGLCTVNATSGLLTPTGAGPCVVTATRGSSGNFAATSSAPFTVTVNRAAQTVDFTSTVPTRPLPNNTYTPSATATSGLAPTFSITQGDNTVCTMASGVVTIVASGTCEITVEQVGDNNWLPATPVTQTMVAGRLNQSISFASVSTKTFGDPVFSLGATASSGRAVEYAVISGTNTCSVAAGGVITLGVIGTCVVEASQPGDNVYLPADSLRRSITVVPTVPSSPFLASVSTNDGSVTVAYTAPAFDGGLPVLAYSVEVRFAGAERSYDVVRTDCTLSMTCYIDGLTNGRSYSVTVTAKNAVGAGAPSNTSPLILPILNPQAVRGLTARAGNQVIDAAWAAPSNLGGGTFTRYEISIRDRSGVYQTPISITDASATSYQFTGLDNGTGYDIKVVTITSSGTSEFTGNTAEVYEIPRTVPAAPRDITIAAPTGRIARVSWRVPQSDGGSSITSYVVNAQTYQCVLATPTDVVCEISGLTPGSPLSIEVRAVNGVGQSQAASASINLPNRPNAPTMRSVVIADTSAVVAWSPPTSDGGQPILGYLVFVTETGTRVTNSALAPSAAQCSTLQTTCQIEGLDATKKYAFTVRAVNAVGESESSQPFDPFAKAVITKKPTKKPGTNGTSNGSSHGETTKPGVTTTTTVPAAAPSTTVPQDQSTQTNSGAATWWLLSAIAAVLCGWFLLFAWRRRRKSE